MKRTLLALAASLAAISCALAAQTFPDGDSPANPSAPIGSVVLKCLNAQGKALAVSAANPCPGLGGSSSGATDGAAFTAGTSTSPTVAVYWSSVPTVSSGQQGALSMSARRELYIDIQAGSRFETQMSAGTAAPGATTPTSGLLIGGSDGTNFRPVKTDTAGNQTPNFPSNITPSDCSGTIAAGGTAQNAITASASIHGFSLVWRTTAEPGWISFTGTAAPNAAGSFPLTAATATTFAGAGSFTTPPGFGPNTNVSIYGATTADAWSCVKW